MGFSEIDWGELFGLSVPVWDILIRGTAVYWFLFLVFRFVIRRDVGAVGIADILLLVIVADASQNAMTGETHSITEGLILVSTLIAWNVLLDWLSYRFELVGKLAQPSPLVLFRDGHYQRRNMRREFITEDELWSKLRQQGVESIEEVKSIYLEPDGEISVIKLRK